MRSIDANYLIEECHWVIRSDGTRVFVCHVEDIENAPTIINNTPIVDMKPVIHGYWIQPRSLEGISCICSNCGWKSYLHENDVYDMSYCPNCGAKMDGAE